MDSATPTEHESRNERKPLRLRLLKMAIVSALLLLFLAAAAFLVFREVWKARFFSGYDPSLSLNIEVREKEVVPNGGMRERFSFQVEPEVTADAVYYYPADATEPVPCIVMLLWFRAKIEYLERFADVYLREGVAVICPEGLGFHDSPNIPTQRGFKRNLYTLNSGRRTMIETRKILDFLEGRPEIDSSRIYLSGVSLGAILAAPALVIEERYRAGVLMFGAGNFRGIMDAYSRRREIGITKQWMSRLAGTFLKPVDPLNWIDKVAPRPVLFQNTRADEIIPMECIVALHRKAREPKKVLWYEGKHEGDDDAERILEVVGDHLNWLRDLPASSNSS